MSLCIRQSYGGDKLFIGDDGEVSDHAAAAAIREAFAAGKHIKVGRDVAARLLDPAEVAAMFDTVQTWPSTHVTTRPPDITLVFRRQNETIPSLQLLHEVGTNRPFKLLDHPGAYVAIAGFRLPWRQPPTDTVQMRLYANDVYLTDVVFWPGQTFSKLELCAVPGTQELTLKCIHKLDVAVEHVVSPKEHYISQDQIFFLRSRWVAAGTELRVFGEELCSVEMLPPPDDDATVTVTLDERTDPELSERHPTAVVDSPDTVLTVRSKYMEKTKHNTLVHCFGSPTADIVHDSPPIRSAVSSASCVYQTKVAVRFEWARHDAWRHDPLIDP